MKQGSFNIGFVKKKTPNLQNAFQQPDVENSFEPLFTQNMKSILIYQIIFTEIILKQGQKVFRSPSTSAKLSEAGVVY